MLVEVLESCEQRYGEKILCHERRGETMIRATGVEFIQAVKKRAAILSAKTPERCHIGLLGSGGYEMIVSMLAVMCSNRIAVPLNKSLGVEELSQNIEMSDVEKLLFEEEEEELAKELEAKTKIGCIKVLTADTREMVEFTFPKINENELAMILYSSGTTGESKAVMLSQKNLSTLIKHTKLQSRHRRIWAPLPAHHIAFFQLAIFLLARGDEIFFVSDMRNFFKDMEEFKPQQITLVPAMYHMLLERMKRLPNFKKVIEENVEEIWSLGAPLAIRGNDSLKDKVGVVNIYGLTESSGTVVELVPGAFGSVGLVASYNEMRIENGEILFRGDNIMMGYYKEPKQSAEVVKDGWLYTGDIGEIKDGCLFIKGRVKNTIILSNGENVNPEELEAKICQNESVDAAYIYEKDGKINAAVLIKSLLENQNEQIFEKQKKELEIFRKELNKKLPAYQKIWRLEIRRKDFERTSIGKIKRRNENEGIGS